MQKIFEENMLKEVTIQFINVMRQKQSRMNILRFYWKRFVSL